VKPTSCLSDIIAELREQHRLREDFHRAEKSLTLRIKAQARRLNGDGQKDPESQIRSAEADGGEGNRLNPEDQGRNVALAAALPLIDARDSMRFHRKAHEKRVVELARRLPIWPWIEATRGVGPLALGQLIAELGDLCNYANPAKVWKRFSVAVIDGERQRRIKGEKAIEHGYCPRRRSILYLVGIALRNLNDGVYRQIYEERKEYEAGRPWCGKCKPKGAGPAYTRDHCTPGHVEKRARRYMEKRFLRDLWIEWNRTQAELTKAAT